MSAQHPADIIAQAIRMYSRTEGAGSVGEIALSKLTASGYRILWPGELDAETLERAAEVADSEADLIRYSDEGPASCEAIAAAIRALKGDHDDHND